MSMFDMANMRKLKSLGAKAPDTWKGFLAFDEAARADGDSEEVQGVDGGGGRADHAVPLLHQIHKGKRSRRRYRNGACRTTSSPRRYAPARPLPTAHT